MLSNILLLVVFIWFSYALVVAIIKGKIDSYYGENMSPSFKDEPLGYIGALVIYIGIWLFLAYILCVSWPWL